MLFVNRNESGAYFYQEICCSALAETRTVVVGVAALHWEKADAINADLGDCPNNGGKRIFPDKLSPTDSNSELRRQVKLTATVAPPIAGVTVYFRVFDVDDPFDQLNPSMPDVGLIDDDMSGGDNRPVGSPDPAVGTYQAVNDANGKATVTITVSMQPGNNYRAAASLIQEALTQTTMYDGQTVNPQQHADALNGTSGSSSGYSVPRHWSQMLTVWRKLHVERDTMAAPDPFDFRVDSQVTAIYATPGRPGTTTVEISCPQGDANPDENNYEGGEITFANCSSGSDTFGILENYPCNEFSPYRIIIVGTPGACAAIGTPCSLVDDDDMQALGTSSSPRFPNGGLLLYDAFKPAFILPVYADPQYQDVVAFESYLDYWGILSGAGSWNGGHDLPSTVDFWSALVVGAWEGGDSQSEVTTDGDADPDDCPLIPGPIAPGAETPLTGVRRPFSRQAVVFFQALADDADCINQTDESHTCVHELAHTCGDMPHKDGTIMETGAPKNQDSFDANQLKTLREQNPW